MFRANLIAVLALGLFACGGDEEVPATTSLRGMITVSPALLPLADGVGRMCVGLYDVSKACPVGGDPGFVRVTGQEFSKVDLNAQPKFDFTLDLKNVLPGTYLFSARFDGDESGCSSAPNSADAIPKTCESLSIKEGANQVSQELASVIP